MTKNNCVKISRVADPSLGPLMSTEDVAALIGVPVDDVRACVQAQRDDSAVQSIRLPAEWIEQGRSRAEAYRQATGRSDMQGAVLFWRNLTKGPVS